MFLRNLYVLYKKNPNGTLIFMILIHYIISFIIDIYLHSIQFQLLLYCCDDNKNKMLKICYNCVCIKSPVECLMFMSQHNFKSYTAREVKSFEYLLAFELTDLGISIPQNLRSRSHLKVKCQCYSQCWRTSVSYGHIPSFAISVMRTMERVAMLPLKVVEVLPVFDSLYSILTVCTRKIVSIYSQLDGLLLKYSFSYGTSHRDEIQS